MIKKSNVLRIIFISTACCLLISLTGCWDYRDIEKKSVFLSVGVDKINENIEFINEIAALGFSEGKTQEKSEVKTSYIVSAQGKNFEDARLNLRRKLPFPVFLGATRVVALSKNFAKEDIRPYINRINKIYDFRKTLLVVISKDSPRELFDIKLENDISVGFLIEDTINNLKNEGKGIYTSVGEILSDIELGETGYLIPYVGKEKNSVNFLGLAVMKDSKLAGIIEFDNIDGILYLLGEKPKPVELIQSPKDKNNYLSFQTNVKRRKINSRYEGGKVIIDIDLQLDAELRYQYYLKSINKDDEIQLNKKISEKVKKDIIDIIKISQNKYECDFFEFAKYFRASYPKIYSQIDWSEKYPKAQINVNVNTQIVNQNLFEPDTNKNNKGD